MVNNLIQQDILVPVRVTLGEERFRYQVSGELGLVTIVKIDDVRACVEDWVVVGQPNRVAVQTRGLLPWYHLSVASIPQ